MADTDRSASDAAADALDQIRQLRIEVDRLMRERVAPALAQAADDTGQTARSITEIIEEQTDAVCTFVRTKPFRAMAIAGLAGYLIGRVTR